MAGNAFYVHTDLHTASLAPVDSAVGGLCGYHELGTNLVLIDDVLPAQAVAILLLYGSRYQDRVLVGEQPQILHDPGSVYGGYNTSALVGYASSSDLGVVLIALIGVKLPVVLISDSNGVNVGVKTDEGLSGSHVSENVAHGVDLYLVKFQLSHLLGNAVDVGLLIAALAGKLNDVPQKLGHVLFVVLCSFLDLAVIQAHFIFLHF